jgi:hypothetical protein
MTTRARFTILDLIATGKIDMVEARLPRSLSLPFSKISTPGATLSATRLLELGIQDLNETIHRPLTAD